MMNNTQIPSIFRDQTDPTALEITRKVFNNERISFDEGVWLFEHGDLSLVGALANHIRLARAPTKERSP